mmetsp:Transcript_9596/g.17940  ORF Transcript_9596/g.17940 Transcript_9596/m.17940 type:complete len:1093 (-) Transcript_9596:879-4157(-)
MADGGQRREGVPLTGAVSYDDDIYGGSDKGSYRKEVYDEEEDIDESRNPTLGIEKEGLGVRIEREVLEPQDEGSFSKPKTIYDRENEYQRRRLNRTLSPTRPDAFTMGDRTPDNSARSYADVIRETQLRRTMDNTLVNIIEKKRAEADGVKDDSGDASNVGEKRRNRWDQSSSKVAKVSEWDAIEATPTQATLWDATPGASLTATAAAAAATPAASSRWDAPTPAAITRGGEAAAAATPAPRKNRWDDPTPARPAGAGWGGETPAVLSSLGGGGETPAPSSSSSSSAAAAAKPRSRWDQTPALLAAAAAAGGGGGATPAAGSLGLGVTPSFFSAATPAFGMTSGMETPLLLPTPAGAGAAAAAALMGSGGATPVSVEQFQEYRLQREMYERNRPLTDEDLDAMLPGEAEGYKILAPPPGYKPAIDPAARLLATPLPTPTPGFTIQEEGAGLSGAGAAARPDLAPQLEGLPSLKEEDQIYFSKLLQDVDEAELSVKEQKERKILKLLLKIKNGTPPQRKAALRQITDKARDFGAGPLFDAILPLLMQTTLEDQERHLLVKVIDRVLYKLDELVRPYVHKILVVIEPLLIDEDYYARVEGREIIANLSKAAGLAQMISSMRADIDDVDEFVRNTTARAFSVVASALGIREILPFIRAVCASRKSWQARHTGVKIVQQIAILMGCSVLPYLKELVDVVRPALTDENQKVKTIGALSIAALAEAAAPYGIESFDEVVNPLYKGIRLLRGKVLAAFLKAIGFVVPLMDSDPAKYYTSELMLTLRREFATSDEEMKKVILKVVKQVCSTVGVTGDYVRTDVLPDFFKSFWTRRMAMDKRNYSALVETTVALAEKVGGADIVARVVEGLKDENELFRRMTMDTIDKVIQAQGAGDVDARLEEILIDGALYAFQEQVSEDGSAVLLNGFGTIINALGRRAKPYLPQVCGTIKWRLNNKSAKVRQQAADLINRIAPVMHACEEEGLLGHLGVVLYEYLGEEYPEVLGSILGAIKAIVSVVGMTKMTPPINELLLRLTPILKNRHEKVQENCIDLVGRIADRGAEYVSAREWMRICFELLELLKAHKKSHSPRHRQHLWLHR